MVGRKWLTVGLRFIRKHMREVSLEKKKKKKKEGDLINSPCKHFNKRSPGKHINDISSWERKCCFLVCLEWFKDNCFGIYEFESYDSLENVNISDIS